MINEITPVELNSKCKRRLEIKPYGGATSEDFVDHICPTLRRKPDVIAIHIGTNDITNADCSSLQTNLGKIRVSYRTIFVNKNRPIFHHSMSWQEQYQCKANRGNEITKQFCKINKLDLIDNTNIKDQKLYDKKKLNLNDAGKSLLANNFIKYFINMWLTIRPGSQMSSPYQRNDKNQNKVLTSSSNHDKSINSDPEVLAYPSYFMIGYLNINSIRNEIVQLTDICKTSPIEILCIDETKLDSSFPNAQVHLPDYHFPHSEGTGIHQEEENSLHSLRDSCEKVNCLWNSKYGKHLCRDYY